MSENEIIELVQKNVENPTISTDTGLEAAQKIGKIAESEKFDWALAGGVAMYLYGSPRLTKDVDVIASNHLSLKADAPLILTEVVIRLRSGNIKLQLIGLFATTVTRSITERLWKNL